MKRHTNSTTSLRATAIIFLIMLTARGFVMPSAKAGTNQRTDGYQSIGHPGGFSGVYIVSDNWYKGDGSTRSISQMKFRIEYQGNTGDDAYLKLAIYELKVREGWGNYCNPTCVWGITSYSVQSVPLIWSYSYRARDVPDLNTARNNPNTPVWATINFGPVSVGTSKSDPDPSYGSNTATTDYYEYAAIDQDNFYWAVGYANLCSGYAQAIGPLTCFATLSLDWNWWGGGSWWQFNVQGCNGFCANIELNVLESWS